MTDPIQFPSIQTPSPATAFGGVSKVSEAKTGKDFKSMLLDSLEEVNRLQIEADAGVQRLLTGETDNAAEVLAAASKAGLAFDLLMQVRNRLTEAYQEIQQMRV